MTDTLTAPSDEATETATYVLPAQNMLRAIRATAICASKDHSRPVITAISVEVRDGEATVSATDSYRLGTVTFDAPDCADGAFLISSTLTAKLCKAYNRSTVSKLDRGAGSSRIGFHVPESVQAPVTVTLDGETLNGPMQAGTYPDWRQVSVSEDNYRHQASAFNPAFLADLGKCAVELGADNGTPCKVLHMDAFQPAVFAMDLHNMGTFRYVLMPVRIAGWSENVREGER